MATIQIIPNHILRAETAPSNQLTKGIIGCGGISSSHLKMPGKLLALCDVDSKHLANRMGQVNIDGKNDVRGYEHFEELIA